ncbi:restriction endonuclease subunit S [Paenarthrobacter sp. MSM-2-10-13]|uniref:restriction endonuclease subunit S n=1 Tax=Paenarthrobacter sp. MSM-2-10-13 TaxID=2717318 RepID=UPI00141F4FDE|nr:restriction endonuclease subunit S [Paenarthrobacter sp. MSM-2-10-13]NHW47113.1 restriction endonuclease subunit S [Paenarthrobacter sp. MSM-2-10-13]
MTWYGTTDLQVTSFKRLFEVTLGKMLQTESTGPTDSLTPYLNSAAVQDGYVEDSFLKSMWASDTDRQNLSVRANDLVVCEGGDVGRSALVKADSSAIFQNSVHRVRPRQGIDIRFAKYTLDALRSSSYLDVLCNKATIRHFTADKLANLEIPHASPDYQRAACDYLDRETAQIDELIGKQERLIELLAEKRQAIITHAVTKGLDPTAPTKPSGIPWLGDVPAHWTVRKFSQVTAINAGQVDPKQEPWASMLLIAPNHVESGKGRITHRETSAYQGADSGKYLVKAGEVIYSKIRPYLRKVVIAPEDCLCSADMYGIRASPEVMSNRFLQELMLSQPFTDFTADSSARVAMPKINRESLAQGFLWYPSLSEQEAILGYIDRESALTDRLEGRAKMFISLLRERRSALISAAVTGKIDVREGAAQS